MRRFSNEEKQIISQLVEHTKGVQPFLPINLFNDIFQIGTIGFDCQQSLLYFSMQNGQIPNVDYMTLVYNMLLEKVMLLEYLQNEGLVYLVHMATTTNTLYTTGTISTTQQPVQYPVDQSISQALFHYMNDPIYVGETLKALVESGFKSFEDLSLEEAQKQTSQSRRQTFLSLAAVILSLVAILSSQWQSQDSGIPAEPLCIEYDNDTTTYNIPIGVMLNKIEGKLEATMNNTAEIHAKLCDTINVRIKGGDRTVIRQGRNPSVIKKDNPKQDNCIKQVKIDTCNDTIVSKKSWYNRQ